MHSNSSQTPASARLKIPSMHGKWLLFLTSTNILLILAAYVGASRAESATKLSVRVGEPRVIDRYEGTEETSPNFQTHHFCNIIKAGNGNLIGLWCLSPDQILPEDVDVLSHSKNSTGYRVSKDNGSTWSELRTLTGGGIDGGTLADGSVILFGYRWWVDEHEFRVCMHRTEDGGETWSRNEDVRVRFPADRFLRKKEGGGNICALSFWVTTVIPLDEKNVLATVSGRFAGNDFSTSILVKSEDGGRSWRFFSVIAADKKSKHRFGYFGTALGRLADGSLLAVLQTEYERPRVLVQCRSYDGGTTWTEPVACPGLPQLDPADFGPGKDYFTYTTPEGKTTTFSGAYQHPALLKLQNGVLALTYGRPGIQVAFSSRGDGKQWDRVETIVPFAAPYSYSDIDVTSGKPAFVSIADNKLLLIYDIRKYVEKPGDFPRNTVFVREVVVNTE